MNVEGCAHTKAIKYLYKYIYKEHVCVTIVIEFNIGDTNDRQRPLMQCDEVKQDLNCGYISVI